MNAYELADELNKFDKTSIVANMLRQQADRIADLETTLAFKKTKPLSDEEIAEIGHKHGYCLNFARAIEERHGIK